MMLKQHQVKSTLISVSSWSLPGYHCFRFNSTTFAPQNDPETQAHWPQLKGEYKLEPIWNKLSNIHLWKMQLR